MKFTFKITETSEAYVDVHGDSYPEAAAELDRMYSAGEFDMNKYGEYESNVRLTRVEY